MNTLPFPLNYDISSFQVLLSGSQDTDIVEATQAIAQSLREGLGQESGVRS